MPTFSKSITELIESFRMLPGIGRKSAQRLALHLLDKDRISAVRLADGLNGAIKNISYCQKCQLLSDDDICAICSDERRNSEQLCVVESPLDMLAIEESLAYKGRYFILNGKISPLDGIGPNELKLPLLKEHSANVNELVLATSASIEGEATAHFIMETIQRPDLKITRIAYGVPFGGELEYLDQQTLFHAFSARVTV